MRFFFECSPEKLAYRLLFVAALIYVYLWRGTSGAQVAHSVRAGYVLLVFFCIEKLEAVSGVHHFL